MTAILMIWSWDADWAEFFSELNKLQCILFEWVANRVTAYGAALFLGQIFFAKFGAVVTEDVLGFSLVKFLHFSLFNLCPLPLAFWISTLVSGIFTMHLGVTLYVILFSYPGHSESQRVIVDLKWLGASWLDSSRQRCFKDNGPAQTKGSFFAATPFCNLCAPNPSRILQPRGVVSASKILHSGYSARLQVLEGFQSEGTVYGAPNS